MPLSRLLILALHAALSYGAVFTVPPGLNPGDPYRLVFVTAGHRDALSTNIGDYNSFVDDAANAGGSYLQPLGATWKAIASTESVAALANIGGANPTPIYRLDGTLVANGTADLFDWGILAPINITELDTVNSFSVWTGTLGDGTQYPGAPLGSTRPAVGLSYVSDSRWIGSSTLFPTFSRFMYGISEVLNAPGEVPEPASILLMSTGVIGLWIAAKRRRKPAL